MADEKYESGAWIVPVWTKRLAGGPPVLVAYGAGFDEEAEAVEAVKKKLNHSDDKVGEAVRIRKQTAYELGLTPGAVRML